MAFPMQNHDSNLNQTFLLIIIIATIIYYPLSFLCDDPSMPAWGRAGGRGKSFEAVVTYSTDKKHSTYKVKRDGPQIDPSLAGSVRHCDGCKLDLFVE